MTSEKYRKRKHENMRRFRERIYVDPERYSAFRSRCREYERRYREKCRARLADDSAALSAHKAKCRAWKQQWDAQERRRKATSADFYALWRADRRIRYAAKRVMAGKIYRGCTTCRVPNWCVMDAAVDVRSQWLVENLTPSQRAYARELAIERNRLK